MFIGFVGYIQWMYVYEHTYLHRNNDASQNRYAECLPKINILKFLILTKAFFLCTKKAVLNC
jgi:hypothetical protein